MTDELDPIEPQNEEFIEPVSEPEESTEARLRAFEDAHLGEDHLRMNDKIERGVGSHFSRLSDKHKAHHAALETLIAVEKEHQVASAAEEAAHTKLEAAINRAAETEKEL